MRLPLPAILLLALAQTLAAATYEVGSGKSYTTLAGLPTLAAGDLVQISSGLNEVKRWTQSGAPGNPITIRGVGASRPLISASGKIVDGSLPNPRAVFQIEASHVVIEHLELANARNGNNGGGIRVTGSGITGVVIRDCRLHDNDMGMQADGHDGVLVEHCEIDHNGTAAFAGYSHNIYVGGGRITFRGCHIHDALYGQNVKSRAHFTALLYNRIVDSQDGEVGLVEAADTATANSNAVLIGNVIVAKNRGAGWNTTRFIWFGDDGGGAHQGTLYAYNNTFIAGATSNIFLFSNRTGSPIVARNNIFVGSLKIADGSAGAVTGANNWLPTGATVPGGFTGSVLGMAPGFVSANSDLHLLVGAASRNIGVAGSTYADGAGASQSGVPAFTYEGLGNLVARASDGSLDAGAYEYSTGSGGGGGSGGGTITVALTAPATGSSTAPANFTLTATANDTAGAITSVIFRRDGVLLGTDTVAPYSWSWNGVAAGTYVLTATASGPSGSATSAGVTVTVTAPAGGGSAPVVSSSDGGGCGTGSLAASALAFMLIAALRLNLR